MSLKQLKTNSQIPDIELYYRRLVEKYGADPRADGYSSELARIARFDMYIEHFDFGGKSVLDVGCGTGMFLQHLTARKILPRRYVGIDVLPEKADDASALLFQNGTFEWCHDHGVEVSFKGGDISSIDETFDIVIACSIFDVKQTDVPTTFKLACQTMGVMWERCSEGIGVDFFSPYALDIQPFNAPIPPEWVFTWAMQNLNSRVLLDYCVDEETEVLTEVGWKKFDDLKVGDKVLSKRVDDVMEYVRVIDVMKMAQRRREMVHVKTRNLDHLVTKNHALWVSDYVGQRKGKWGSFKRCNAEDVVGKRFRLSRSGKWAGDDRKAPIILPARKVPHGRFLPERRIDVNTWLEFLGYFLSEGCVWSSRGRDRRGKKRLDRPHGVGIAKQADKARNEKIVRCIKRAGFSLVNGGNNWTINSVQLAEVLWPLRGAVNKHVPREFMNLSARQLRILFDALWLGDGAKNGHQYGSVSERLADNVQELALKLGMCGTIWKDKNSGRESLLDGRVVASRFPLFMVSISKCQLSPDIGQVKSKRAEQVRVVSYDGPVFCCTLERNGIMYVRRNGKPVWTGNSYLPHDYSMIARKGDNMFVKEWKRRGGWEREKGGEE